MTEKNKPGVSAELAADPNWVAWEDSKELLKKTAMEKWVGFANGQLFGIADSREDLSSLANQLKIDGYFFKQVTEEEPVYHLPFLVAVRRK